MPEQTKKYQVTGENIPGCDQPEQFYLVFSPKKDITAYELARCVPFLIDRAPVNSSWFDKNAKYARHFEVIPV